MEKLTVIRALDLPRKAYQITYRIAGERTSEGTRQQRYDALIEKLEALPAVLRRGHFDDEAHIATSSWLVETTDQRASTLGRKLSRGLTAGVDLLEILRVAPGNRYELTVEAPKPKR